MVRSQRASEVPIVWINLPLEIAPERDLGCATGCGHSPVVVHGLALDSPVTGSWPLQGAVTGRSVCRHPMNPLLAWAPLCVPSPLGSDLRQIPLDGSVSKVEMVASMALTYKALFSSISTFETLP